jgi:hypothetical protein
MLKIGNGRLVVGSVTNAFVTLTYLISYLQSCCDPNVTSTEGSNALIYKLSYSPTDIDTDIADIRMRDKYFVTPLFSSDKLAHILRYPRGTSETIVAEERWRPRREVSHKLLLSVSGGD